MKDSTERSRNYTYLEQLTTPELEGLLQQDFATAGDDGPDVDLIMAVMEVIKKREAEDVANLDVDAAWEDLQTRFVHNTPQNEAPQVPPVVSIPQAAMKQPKKSRRLRWAISVAAMLCLLVGLMIVPAHGQSLLDSLVEWTSETFSFLSESKTEVPALDAVDYEQLQNAVVDLTDLPVLPSWYPEGSKLKKLTAIPLDDHNILDILFSLYNKEYSLVIMVYNTIPEGFSMSYEKNSGTPETYYANNIPHYIMSNTDHAVAVWRNETAECMIQGHLTTGELKQMIDSIYNEGVKP